MHRVLLASLLFLLALSGVAQAGTISGKVTNTSGGPIADSRVDAIEVVGSGYLLRKSVFTSATGAYSLDGLAAGTYLVRFEGNTLLQREYYANKASRDGSTQIPVTATGTVTGIDAVLGHWPLITGKVTDASTGLPVQNAIVIFGDSLAATRTAADGTYRLTLRDEAATSTDRLRFTDRDGLHVTEWYDNKPSYIGATELSPALNSTTTANAALVRGGTVAGRVTDTQGVPLPGFGVAIASFRRTDADGRYQSDVLTPGTRQVTFSGGSAYPNAIPLARPVTVTAGVETTGVDVTIQNYGSIRGTAFDGSGNPTIVGITVHEPDGTKVRDTSTNSDGTFDFRSVVPGSYRIRFNGLYFETTPGTIQWHRRKPTLASSDPVIVASGQTKVVNAYFAAGGRITGTVTDPDGTPSVSCEVRLYNTAGELTGRAFTAADGTYSLGGLPPSSYSVQFLPGNESQGLPEYYVNQATLGAADPVTIVDGQTTAGVDATLALGKTIQGHVTAEDGHGIRKATVQVIGSAGGGGSATTNANGFYRVSHLPPGTYRLRFVGPRSSEFDEEINPDNNYLQPEYYENKQLLQNATPVTLTSQTTTIDASLAARGLVRGTVTTDAGLPLRRAKVFFVREDGLHAGPFLTDTSGGYRYEAYLLPGRWKIYFQSPYTAHQGEYYNDKPTLGSADFITVLPRKYQLDVNATLSLRSNATALDASDAFAPALR